MRSMVRLAWVIALLAAVGIRGAETGLGSVPVSRWQVQAKAGDTVRLSAAGDSLRLDVDLDVREQVLLGHITFHEAAARLLLAEPVKLTTEQRRIIFEAMGIRKTIEKESYLQLLVLVRDATGEVLRYEPYPMPHLLAGTERWTQWGTRYLYGAEAGGATQNIFLSDGNGDGNAWPDGELEFIGFEVQLHPPKPGRYQHTLHLGQIEFGGMVIPFRDPFVYADALVTKAGDYRFAAEVTCEFQGPVLRQLEQRFTFAPASPDSGRQRLVIPLGPDGNYWIRYQVTDGAGAVVNHATLRRIVENNPAGAVLNPVALTEPPLLGHTRVNPTRPGPGGVYGPEEPLAVAVRLFPKGEPALSVVWRLLPYAYETPLDQGTVPVTFPAEAAPQDLVITPKLTPGRDAYRLRLEIKAGDRVVDAVEYVLGRRTDSRQPRASRQGLIRGRDYVKRAAYFRTTYAPEGAKSEDASLEGFNRYLDETVKIAGYVTCSIDLADFEVLPGVFDFAELDRMMDAAADRGCAVTIRSLHVDARSTYRWLPYSRQLSYDGTEIVQNYYGAYSGVDPVYLDLWKRANRALHDRYQTHPGFQGYYLMMPGGEWSILCDKPWIGVLAGYEKAARQAYRDYLRQVEGFTVEKLNARWGTAYRDWAEIMPPLPEFRTGTRPDMRVEWLDFCRFKDYVNTRYWYLELARDIRTYDREHVVIVYAPPTIAGLEALIDYTHGGGVPALPGRGEGEAAWLTHRVGAIQESHHPHRWNCYGDPGARGWVLDWCLYTMVSAFGGGGANLHIYYVPLAPITANYGQEHGYDRYEKFLPIFRELQEIELVAPGQRQIAVWQDPTSVFAKHRSNFMFRLPDLSRWFELLAVAGIEHEKLDPARLGQYQLVLPNLIDEVVSLDTIELLDRYARGGGKMIISAVNGRYCPELGQELFPLLRRLGIQPPAVPFDTSGLAVAATVVADTPLWARGAKVPFFTAQNLREDPRRDERIRTSFFTWPYRWIPLTDYFGWYRGHEVKDGQVLATFDGGGTAVSSHRVGQGEVIVFWGVPDYQRDRMEGFMARAAAWAGVQDPRLGEPIPLMFEARNPSLKRHYAILWQEKPGTYRQRLPNVPDGTWFVEDLVSDEKLGTWTSAELREGRLPLEFRPGQSPLKVLRIGEPRAGWMKHYRQPAPSAGAARAPVSQGKQP